EATLVDLLAARRLPVLFHQPELLEHLATDPDPVMAGDTAPAHEVLEAGLRPRWQRVRVSAQKRVKGRRGEECALVGANGLADIRRRQRCGLVGKRLLEQARIAFDGFDPRRDDGMVWLPRAEHPDKGLLGLLLKRLAIAPPMLHEVESRIEDRGRIARMRPMLDADGSGKRIRTIEGGLMARRAAHVPLHCPPWIKEQHPSERDAGRTGR